MTHNKGLQQFAQRIEQPLQCRINRLVDTLNAKDAQIEQLREALQGFLDAFNGGYEPSLQTVFIASKAMEQTK